MKFSDLKIGTKLILSFVVVVIIFSGVASYQIINLMSIKTLEDTSAERSDNILSVMQMMDRMDEFWFCRIYSKI